MSWYNLSKSAQSNWKSENTSSQDCSVPEAFPWGFQDFEWGTPGAAVLDYFVNQSFSEGDPDFSIPMEEELNMWIKNPAISKDIANSWDNNGVKLMTLPLMEEEKAIKGWLSTLILKYAP